MVQIWPSEEGDFDQFHGQKPVFWKWLARALSVCASEASTQGSRAARAQPKAERAKQMSPYERK